MNLSKCIFVKKGMAKMAKGGRLRAKRMHNGKRAKAIRPALPPEVHQAFSIVYCGMYGATSDVVKRLKSFLLFEGATLSGPMKVAARAVATMVKRESICAFEGRRSGCLWGFPSFLV